MRTSIIVIVAIAALALGAFYPKVDTQEKEEMILTAVQGFLNQVHFRPVDLNDEFSEAAFDYYLKTLDASKRFLTNAEIEELESFKFQIDDQARIKSFEFFNNSVELIDQAIVRAEDIFENVIDQEFDFSLDESLDLDAENRMYAKDEVELKEYWRQLIKYEILNRLENKIDEQDADDEIEASDKKSTEELEKEARESVEEIFEGWFKRLKKVRRSDRFEAYINTITHMNDPHSDYYNPKEKQDFDINMGGKLEGIGARLQSSKEYIKIVDIIPGGPAWKGKELQVDDLITKVRQDGEEETLDITGMRLDDVVQKIRGKKGTKVILTVKKPDGSFNEIEIVRDLVILEDGNAKSALLNLEDVDEMESKEIGYIYLPKFYDDFEAKDGRSCADHVAIELEKLDAQGVAGVILDLRNNGGGSLRDVVTMSGLFIEEGPIVQVRPRDGKPYVLKDDDKSVTYDGPLIVMVNNYSASASEILAAALQDYKRAVIVGSSSTFGKGTVQRFFDLDRAIRGNNELKPLGQVKITTQKFYRVNGGSTQLKGVTPDVILPDVYEKIKTGENRYDRPIEWSEIEPVEYGQMVYQVDFTGELQHKSKMRVDTSASFKMIRENAIRLKENQDDTKYPLSYDTYNTKVDEMDVEAAKYKNLFDVEVEGISASNLSQDLEKFNIDSSRMARNERWIEGLHKDIYLEETIRVMYDMLDHKKS